MSRRLSIVLCSTALVATACGSIPEGEVVAGEGERFVPFVAEFLDDAGLGSAVAVDAEGVPYASYFIFPAQLEEGEIPVSRPIGAPYITTDPEGDAEPKEGAAVGVASLSADGVWTRGAAAQVRDIPQGVYIPYGPALEQSLIGATAQSTNGTDIAVGAEGEKHVVWTGDDGVFIASGTDSFTVERLYDYGVTLRRAGPIGRPSVAVDADGNRWVAFTLDTAGQEVRVATDASGEWTTETVASVGPCEGCPPPMPTQIGMTSAGPAVAWVDNAAGAVMVSTLQGGDWIATEVAGGVSGQGLDMAVDADGAPLLTFYDGDGGVQLARQQGASWSLTTIADAAPADAEAIGNLAPRTSIAVDEEGRLTAAWDDADGVVLATSEDGETFEPTETLDTVGGRSPSVGSSPDGTDAYLAWYDAEAENLRFGVLGDVGELAVAAPSPTVDPAEVPAPAPGGDGGECGADGEILLDIVAAGLAFDPTCLVAPAQEPFTINFDNQDDVDATGPHNVAIYVDEAAAESLFVGELVDGPAQIEYNVDPIDAGSYFFRCDVHPTTMTGTLAAIEAGGGGGGGNGGGGG